MVTRVSTVGVFIAAVLVAAGCQVPDPVHWHGRQRRDREPAVPAARRWPWLGRLDRHWREHQQRWLGRDRGPTGSGGGSWGNGRERRKRQRRATGRVGRARGERREVAAARPVGADPQEATARWEPAEPAGWPAARRRPERLLRRCHRRDVHVEPGSGARAGLQGRHHSRRVHDGHVDPRQDVAVGQRDLGRRPASA